MKIAICGSLKEKFDINKEKLMNKLPKVGVAVIIIKDSKVLLGLRKGSHSEGTWAFPGGHLEFNESWENCARREVHEETGIKIKNIRFVTATNDILKKENKHIITLFMLADFASGKVQIKEPDRCERWEWFGWDKLPKNIFFPIQILLKQKYNPLKSAS